MSRFRISQAAEEDIERIWDYVAVDSPEAATQLTVRFVDAFAKVAEFPGIGLKNNAIHPGFSRFPVGKYIIFYDAGPEVIEIARVLHAARDIHRILGSD